MYGGILRLLRESKGRTQAEVARTVGISSAQLARLESHKRGLSVVDFVRIAEVLGEKPGNLLPNDLGELGYLKPIIDRLAAIRPEFIPRVAAIITKVALLTEDVAASEAPPQKQVVKLRRKPQSPAKRRARRKSS